MKTFEEYKFTIKHTAIKTKGQRGIDNIDTLEDFINEISKISDSERIICEYNNSYYYFSIESKATTNTCIAGPNSMADFKSFKRSHDGWSYNAIFSLKKEALEYTLKFKFKERDVLLTDISEYDGLIVLKFENK